MIGVGPYDVLKKRLAALPRNRHGRRTASALIRLHVNAMNSALVRWAAEAANQREARRTPGDRITDRKYEAFVLRAEALSEVST